MCESGKKQSEEAGGIQTWTNEYYKSRHSTDLAIDDMSVIYIM